MSYVYRLLSPCGLYCGVCRIYAATQAGDMPLLSRLANIYARRLPGLQNLTAQDILCDGCLSERRFAFCRECSIKDCSQGKWYLGCHECDEFPCQLIYKFPSTTGRQVMLRSIPYRRAHGIEKWVQAEKQRYHCPKCGERLYRGVTMCDQCHTKVELG